MASDYRTYLAAKILNEDRVVTYRLLNRALKIHVNVAKQMLFEFHRQQNGKKPGMIHATYIVAGSKQKVEPSKGNSKDGEDEYMHSSPFQSSPVAMAEEVTEHTPVLFVTLVREEDLEALRAQCDTITSIHVYSLGPSPIKDLQILSDSAREIHECYTNRDPVEYASTYGTITNKSVRRRTGRRPPTTSSASATAATKSTISNTKPIDSIENQRPSAASTASQKEKENAPSSQPAKSSQSSAAKDFFAKGPSGKKSSNAQPASKRDNTSIFKSFAKTTSNLKREETDGSVAAAAAAAEVDLAPPNETKYEHIKDMSEDEEDNYIPPQGASKEKIDADRKTRKDREAALRKMMEEEDDEEDEHLQDTEEIESPRLAEMPAEEELHETMEVSGGRRRGKRRVMKKKTVKDEEGYLVTKEELVWESFSEEEIVASKPKTAPSASSNASKPKKGPSKPGQGNIMSFFGKK